MVFYSEMLKRAARRAQIFRDVAALRPPCITSKESVSEHNKCIKDLQADLLEECTAIVEDQKAYDLALVDAANRLRTTPEALFGDAWRKLNIDPQLEEILQKRREKEADDERKAEEAQEKEYQKAGKVPDVPGQQKMFDPKKMPSAEAAGPVTTERLEVVE